jgi:metal-responsive CopG/Arc/MetJ family transcriptional regulator
MTQQAPRVIIVIPADLLARVDEYRFAARRESRSEAVRELLTIALGQHDAHMSGMTNQGQARSRKEHSK